MTLLPIAPRHPESTPQPIRECVEGYVYARGPRRYLLLHRSARKGGFWQSVSGKVEPRDRSYADAVRREVAEETGFSDPIRVTDLEWTYLFPGGDGLPWRLHAFAVEVPRASPPQLTSEHTEFQWLPYPRAVARLYWPDNREALRRLEQKVGP